MKIAVIFSTLLILCGCSRMDSTPSSREEIIMKENTRRLAECKEMCKPFQVQSFAVQSLAFSADVRDLCLCKE